MKNHMTKELASQVLGMAPLSSEAKTRLANGQLKLVNGFVFHKAYKPSFAAGSRVELLEAGNKRKDGVSSFDGQELPPNVNIACNKIRLSYVDAAGTDLSSDKFVGTHAAIPAALQGSEIVVQQDGEEILRLPIENVIPAVASDNVDDNFCYLDRPIAILGGKDTRISILVGDTTLAQTSTQNHKIAVYFGGLVSK